MDRKFSLSRRGFALGAAVAAAGSPALALAPVTPPLAPVLPAAMPVVAFHMDALYIDWTGAAEPYRPPEGSRSGDGLADADLHLLQGWC